MDNAYEITPGFGRVLANLVLRNGRRRVLEFGAGASSRVLSAALAAVGGGMLTSVELDPSWCAEASRAVERTGIDAVLAPAALRFSRDGTMHLSAAWLAPGPVLVLDDAGRNSTQWMLACWLRLYRALRVTAFDPVFGGRGLAMLQWDGQPRARLSLRAWLGSAYHAISLLRRRQGRP